ncbi:myosin light chain 5 isoform X1 [Pteropus medius]|uniref:Myosin light chain 5 isoform X1 n=4 Tax=Pteropodidae TaxID=9398 RepID=A0A6P3RNU5_PTEVA|nr:myosin light chain 5 isoform X1 [Pteropus vampyrus]XP_039694320.1 myosin light chain 5 isoform X1 [Pteropus giganteus]
MGPSESLLTIKTHCAVVQSPGCPEPVLVGSGRQSPSCPGGPGRSLRRQPGRGRRAQAIQSVRPSMASRKTKKKEGGALRAQRASSNVFSNFEQTQIQEFKEAFTLMDQNRDGFIDKEDLKDTYASLGKINVKDDELDAMLKEASGPINFTMFLNMFGEKLSGTDTEETILNAFKMLDPDGKGSVNKDYIKRLLMSQADKMTAEEVDQMLQFATIDAAGNLDYKALSYVLTHGEEKD